MFTFMVNIVVLELWFIYSVSFQNPIPPPPPPPRNSEPSSSLCSSFWDCSWLTLLGAQVGLCSPGGPLFLSRGASTRSGPGPRPLEWVYLLPTPFAPGEKKELKKEGMNELGR